jgi:hypothetical protein
MATRTLSAIAPKRKPRVMRGLKASPSVQTSKACTSTGNLCTQSIARLNAGLNSFSAVFLFLLSQARRDKLRRGLWPRGIFVRGWRIDKRWMCSRR